MIVSAHRIRQDRRRFARSVEASPVTSDGRPNTDRNGDERVSSIKNA
jgi:hypothetical protein